MFYNPNTKKEVDIMKELSPKEIAKKKDFYYNLRNIMLIAIIPILITYFILSNLSKNPDFLTIAVIIGSALIYYATLIIYYKKYYNKFYGILFNQCDPIKYQKVLLAILEQGRFRNKELDSITIELSKAEYFSGEFESAEKELRKVNINKHNNIFMIINYYVALGNCYLSSKNKIGLLNIQKKMLELDRKINYKIIRRKRYKKVYNTCILIINNSIAILENDDILLDLLHLELNEAKSELQKVKANYYIGLKYYELNELNLSEKHLEYAFENGNTSFYAKEAEKLLGLMAV